MVVKNQDYLEIDAAGTVTVLCYTHDRVQIRHLPRPVAPSTNGQTRRGKRNGYRNRRGVWIERKGN